MSTISLPWPVPKVLHKLVWKSSGYFIYASTIIKFVDDRNYRPAERLAILYINILSTVPFAKRPKLIQILCVLVHFDYFTPDDLDQLLGLETGDTHLFLRSLHWIFHVPEDEFDEISTHHASFYDFLRDPKRSQDFYVGGIHHMDLAHSMLRSLAHVYDQDNWCTFQYILNKFLHFIASLPPSVDLLPLIESAIIPEYILVFNEGLSDPDIHQEDSSNT
ncbi:hypothetical protein BDP27DRAFT_1431064 [Rhodocollybia butyracea]|uniref:Uncharacterized protein n=1 Tax=Rhodocollybia butyracea TaxID=206335 RepID=A0A9P5TYB4_9AGAR|nr:hypothetical protein BDP27DRAFT_1431064 [Rhodocollybia butyracea]